MAGNFRSLKAWQYADALVRVVDEATNAFPTDERFGLALQMRRAGVSVAANIAEGATRTSQREYAPFLSVARGSLAELEYDVTISRRLGDLPEAMFQQLSDSYRQTGRTLHGLLQAVKRRSVTATSAAVLP